MGKRNQSKFPFPPLLLLAILFFVLAFSWRVSFPIFSNTIAPQVFIDSYPVGGMTTEQAVSMLSSQPEKGMPTDVHVVSDTLFYSSSAAELGIYRDYESIVKEAYGIGRSGSLLSTTLQLFAQVFRPKHLSSNFSYSSSEVVLWSSALDQLVQGGRKPALATIAVSGNQKSVNIFPGEEGESLDALELETRLRASLDLIKELPYSSVPSSISIPAPVQEIQPLSTEQVQFSQQRAESFLGLEILLNINNNPIGSISDSQLLSFLSLPSGYNEQAVLLFAQELQSNTNQDPAEPVMEWEGEKLLEFIPPENGIYIDIQQGGKTLISALEGIEQTSELRTSNTIQLEFPAKIISPKTSLESLNPYGIKELIGVGESHYVGSIPNRAFNINLTAEKIQYTLIPPGEEYSFNGSVGEISSRTGYKSAYIIQAGRTVLGDGGGVCQVSSTIFRSALYSGLPITMRRGHSYRVGYYEQKSHLGLDATVYSPSVDFKFLNDTPAHILVVTKNNAKSQHLVIEFWGESDGRVSEVDDFKTWGIVPPKPPVYVDDPNLPAGKLQQIDWAAAGAKASFAYTVTRDGEVLQDKVFTTTYQPWASVYLRGTAQ